MSTAPALARQPDFTAAQISVAVGKQFPLANIESNWPLVRDALEKFCPLGTENRELRTAVEIAAIATICVETGAFAPVKERGGPKYLAKLYDGRADLGNVQPGDGPRFCGRGFVQITGRFNYRKYGREIHIDLENAPARALEPALAAATLALYFRDVGIPRAALQGNWERVRRLVNGGLNGWADFTRYVKALKSAAAGLPSAEDLDAVAAEAKLAGAGDNVRMS